MIDFKAFHKISYGLFIISCKYQQKLNGYIGNTVFQVTAEPTKLAISCSKDNYSCELIQQSGVFAVHALNQDCPMDLIKCFGYQSGRDLDKFADYPYAEGHVGVPILKQHMAAVLECEVKQQLDVGTHIIFIGEVLNTPHIDYNQEVLTYDYYQRVYKAKAPKNAPTHIKEEVVANPSNNDIIRHQCTACGYTHPADDDWADTAFEDLPDDWHCPICGADKSFFEKLD